MFKLTAIEDLLFIHMLWKVMDWWSDSLIDALSDPGTA